jgi:TolB-like protein/Tfp pilus assembly protein PilF
MSSELIMTTEQPESEVPPAGQPIAQPARRLITLQRIGALFAGVAGIGAILGGFTGYWTAYRAVTTEFHAPDQLRPMASRLSIAVMPFANLGGDTAEDYFADGIVDSLTIDLSSHVAGLMVAGRGSAFTFKGRTVDPRQVGASLGVRYLLEGSVRRAGDQVRVTARLIDTESGSQVWAERFDGESSNLVSLQDEITARIANALGAALIRAAVQEAERRTANPDAVDLVFKAESVFLLGNRMMPALNEAEGLYRRALELEPENPDALIGLGAVFATRMFNFRYVLGMTQEQISETNATAIAFLDRGLRLRPDSPIAHSYKGLAYGAGLRWREAMQEYDIAHSLDPNFTPIYNNTANAWSALGEPLKALPQIAEAVRRSPIDPQLGIWHLSRGRADLLLGRWDQAIEANLRARASQGGFINIHLALAAAYAEKGDRAAAKASLDDALALRPGLTLAWLKSHAFSNEPGYVRLANATLYDGLRKAGLQ